MNKIQVKITQSERFQRNKGLLSLQAKFSAAPISSGGTAIVSATLGPQFAPLAYGMLTLVECTPLIIILIKEGVLSLSEQAAKIRNPMPKQNPVPSYGYAR